jgi:hypothetical protein
MKNIKILVISKGRKYYKCKKNGYDCKLICTDELEIGKEYELLVEDISVRSKYGTDLIYSSLEKVDADAGVVTLKHDRFNEILVDKCKKLGGKWDAGEKVWVFSKIVEKEVEDLDVLFNDDVVDIEIKSLKDIYAEQSHIEIFGYSICRAFDRDSGAKISENVCLISGRIGSCGSRKNWRTYLDKGSIFRLSVSKNLIDKIDESENWEIKILY